MKKARVTGLLLVQVGISLTLAIGHIIQTSIRVEVGPRSSLELWQMGCFALGPVCSR